MAKQQSFADKAKSKQRSSKVSVKVIKGVKSQQGNYKFQVKFVQLDDIGQVNTIK